MNLPKFIKDDERLFRLLLGDLFPSLELPVPEYGTLQVSATCCILLRSKQFAIARAPLSGNVSSSGVSVPIITKFVDDSLRLLREQSSSIQTIVVAPSTIEIVQPFGTSATG